MDNLDPQDVAAIRMLAGAHFRGEVTLPSGRVLSPDEMQALTSAYAPAAGEANARPEPVQRPEPFRARPSTRAPMSAMQRHGVAWWGRTATHGSCACCQTAGRVYPGYNGGQPMGVHFCAACTGADHDGAH